MELQFLKKLKKKKNLLIYIRNPLAMEKLKNINYKEQNIYKRDDYIRRKTHLYTKELSIQNQALFQQTYIRPYYTYEAAAMKDQTMTRQNIFIKIWKISFRKFIGIRGMPEHSLELSLQDPKLFIQESNDQVRRKINNHNNNIFEFIIKKKQESISLQHISNNLQIPKSFAGHKSTLDNTRMTAYNIIELYISEIRIIYNRQEFDLTHDRFRCGTKITSAHIKGIQSHLSPDY